MVSEQCGKKRKNVTRYLLHAFSFNLIERMFELVFERKFTSNILVSDCKLSVGIIKKETQKKIVGGNA